MRSKWQRIYTSAAGIYAELFCAAVAAIVWSYSQPGIMSHLAFNVVIMAGFSTVVFNGNPLMRFDAYYMLADFLEIPNLSLRGQEYVRSLGRTYLLGVAVDRSDGPPTMAIRLYGVAAWLWRLLVLVSLLITAHALFLGAGLVIAVVAAVLWFGLPAVAFAKYVAVGNSFEKPRVWRFLATVGAAVTLGWLLATAPWPGVVRAPAVVQASPRMIVRSQVAGFVNDVLVRNNQQVQAGQTVIRIDSRELETERSDLQLEIQETKLLRDQLRQQEDLAASQIQTQYLAALQKRLAEKQRELDQLKVLAPISGRVVRRRPESLLGTYVKPGTQLLTVAGHDTRLFLSIGEDGFELFRQRVGQPVHVRVQGGIETQLGLVERVRPHASRKVPRLALAAAAGGPLAVRPVPASFSPVGQTDGKDAYEFVSPRFEGIAHLSASSRERMTTGQLASVWFRSHHETVGQHIYRYLATWIRKRIQAAHTPK